MNRTTRRFWLLAALTFPLALVGLNSCEKRANSAEETTVFRGKVIPLKRLVEKAGSQLDSDATSTLVLQAEDGKIYPLVKDAGSRMFFKDASLLDRPMRLTGRLLPGSTLLLTVSVQSERDKKPHDIYYWCDICSIKRFEMMICECCGAPMELREVPLKR